MSEGATETEFSLPRTRMITLEEMGWIWLVFPLVAVKGEVGSKLSALCSPLFSTGMIFQHRFNFMAHVINSSQIFRIFL